MSSDGLLRSAAASPLPIARVSSTRRDGIKLAYLEARKQDARDQTHIKWRLASFGTRFNQIPDGMIILLQGEAPSRRILVRTEHRHITAVEALMDGTQRDDGVTDGGFVVECLQHPSIPQSGDKEARKAVDGSTAKEIKAPTLLLAA